MPGGSGIGSISKLSHLLYILCFFSLINAFFLWLLSFIPSFFQLLFTCLLLPSFSPFSFIRSLPLSSFFPLLFLLLLLPNLNSVIFFHSICLSLTSFFTLFCPSLIPFIVFFYSLCSFFSFTDSLFSPSSSSLLLSIFPFAFLSVSPLFLYFLIYFVCLYSFICIFNFMLLSFYSQPILLRTLESASILWAAASLNRPQQKITSLWFQLSCTF